MIKIYKVIFVIFIAIYSISCENSNTKKIRLKKSLLSENDSLVFKYEQTEKFKSDKFSLKIFEVSSQKMVIDQALKTDPEFRVINISLDNKEIQKYFSSGNHKIQILLNDKVVATKEFEIKGSDVEDKFIPGLQPVDVYLNLTNKGFSKKNLFSSDFGNSWICKLSQAGVEYEVTIFSKDINKVESVTATAMISPSKKEIISVQQFLIFISSVSYANAKPKEVATWLKKNFNNDKASIVISKVKFTIYAPTKALRMLKINKSI